MAYPFVSHGRDLPRKRQEVKKKQQSGKKRAENTPYSTKLLEVRTFFLTIALTVLLVSPGISQEELLPEGAYGTTIHGGIKAGELKTYVLDGLEGQVLKASLLTRGVDKGATLDLLDSAGTSVLGGLAKLTKVDAVNLVLPKKGRYKLFVRAGGMACSYVLEVTLEDAEEEPPEPSRVEHEGRPSKGDL
jgi:hypothetical protein